uniref:hypothetical protein n=1 Tax=Klebsiella pneumoniae TaxID=573 RepID=UPI00155DD6A4|nr:hypothetical protein [Klebsiella pneumoniae]
MNLKISSLVVIILLNCFTALGVLVMSGIGYIPYSNILVPVAISTLIAGAMGVCFKK